MTDPVPVYVYKCDNDHTFEVTQSMSEDSLDTCQVCGAPARRMLFAPAVHFKGSGFYTTDYARKGAKGPNGSGGEGSGDSKSDKKSESSDSSKSTDSSKGSDSGSGSGSGSDSKSDSKASTTKD